MAAFFKKLLVSDPWYPWLLSSLGFCISLSCFLPCTTTYECTLRENVLFHGVFMVTSSSYTNAVVLYSVQVVHALFGFLFYFQRTTLCRSQTPPSPHHTFSGVILHPPYEPLGSMCDPSGRQACHFPSRGEVRVTSTGPAHRFQLQFLCNYTFVGVILRYLKQMLLCSLFSVAISLRLHVSSRNFFAATPF